MYDIPEIVDDLYFQMVTIPDPKNWPDYIGGNLRVGEKLYSFYAGLKLGIQLSDLCRRELESAPPEREDGDFGTVEYPEGGAGVAQAPRDK